MTESTTIMMMVKFTERRDLVSIEKIVESQKKGIEKVVQTRIKNIVERTVIPKSMIMVAVVVTWTPMMTLPPRVLVEHQRHRLHQQVVTVTVERRNIPNLNGKEKRKGVTNTTKKTRKKEKNATKAPIVVAIQRMMMTMPLEVLSPAKEY